MAKQANIKIEEESQTLKRCTKCGEEKPLKEFHKAKSHKDGFQCHCKRCINKYTKKYYTTRKEELKGYGEKYYAIHSEERREYQRKYNATHSEKRRKYRQHYNEINRDEKRAYDRAYRKTGQGKWVSKKSYAKRRARECGSCEIEGVNLKEILERDNYRCQLCGRKTRPDYKTYHPLYPNVDHIIPLRLSGPHIKKNMQCLCHQCNMKKGFNGAGDQLRMFG